MPNLVLTFAELLAGAVILDAAVKGDTIANVIQGKATQHALPGSGSGTTATTTGGTSGAGASGTPTGALASGTPNQVSTMLQEAQSLEGKPFVSGGGHSISNWLDAAAYDCSGFVSAVLGAGGVIQAPQTTQTLVSQQNIQAGEGQFVTIWDRTAGAVSQEHVIINIAGNWFESGGNSTYNPSGGVSALSPAQASGELSGGGFNPYHPVGL